MNEADAQRAFDRGLVSIARAAVLFRVDRVTLSKRLRDAGKVPLREGAAHLYELTTIAEVLYRGASADSGAGGLAAGLDRKQLQDRKLAVEVRTAELDYYQRAGGLVLADDVERESFTLARQVRDAMMQLPTRLAPEFAVQSDAQVIRLRLDREIRAALEAIAGPDDDAA